LRAKYVWYKSELADCFSNHFAIETAVLS